MTRRTPTGAAREPWLVWTENERETPRRGYGDDELQKTLDHLRKRGDKTVRVQMPHAVAISEVRL